MGKAAYVGVFLDRPSREFLLGRIPGRHRTTHADHVTLAFGKAMEGREYPVGKRVTFRIWGVAWDLKGQAVLCMEDDLREFLAEGQIPHITLSCAEGVQPKYSNELLKGPIDALRQDFTVGGTLDFYPRTVPDFEPSRWQRFLMWVDNLAARLSKPGFG